MRVCTTFSRSTRPRRPLPDGCRSLVVKSRSPPSTTRVRSPWWPPLPPLSRRPLRPRRSSLAAARSPSQSQRKRHAGPRTIHVTACVRAGPTSERSRPRSRPSTAPAPNRPRNGNGPEGRWYTEKIAAVPTRPATKPNRLRERHRVLNSSTGETLACDLRGATAVGELHPRDKVAPRGGPSGWAALDPAWPPTVGDSSVELDCVKEVRLDVHAQI